jgi:hypothetical protein
MLFRLAIARTRHRCTRRLQARLRQHRERFIVGRFSQLAAA